VVAFIRNVPEPGTVFRKGLITVDGGDILPGPFFVIGTATAEEFREQQHGFVRPWTGADERKLAQMVAKAAGFVKMAAE